MTQPIKKTFKEDLKPNWVCGKNTSKVRWQPWRRRQNAWEPPLNVQKLSVHRSLCFAYVLHVGGQCCWCNVPAESVGWLSGSARCCGIGARQPASGMSRRNMGRAASSSSSATVHEKVLGFERVNSSDAEDDRSVSDEEGEHNVENFILCSFAHHACSPLLQKYLRVV